MNYITNLVKIWLDNEDALQSYIADNKGDLANALEYLIEDSAPNLAGLYDDLLRASLDEIDYKALAEAMED